MADEESRITTEVMRAPLDRFVAARTEAVGALRRRGDAALAARIAALRKPSVALWSLNQAGVVASHDLDMLRETSVALRRAQDRVLGGDRAAAAAMQRAGERHRQQLDVVTRRLGIVLGSSGHAAPEATLRRISDGLRAVSIADDDTWRALRDGRLTAEPEVATFPITDAPLAPAAAEDAGEREAAARRKRRDAAVADMRRAESIERAAAEQVASAQRRHEEALRALEEARARLAELDRER